MTEGESLGEILGRALRAEPCEAPAPMEWDYECARYLVAGQFVINFCQHFQGCDFDIMWDRLVHTPDTMLGLLETPQGWSVLASHLANEAGITGGPMLPTIN